MGNQTLERSQDMKTLVLLTIVAFACATLAMELQRKQRQGTPWTPWTPSSGSGSREGLHRKKRQIHQEIESDPKIARPRAMELQRKKRQDYYYYVEDRAPHY